MEADEKIPESKLVSVRPGKVWRLKMPLEAVNGQGVRKGFSGSVNAFVVKADRERFLIIDTGLYNQVGLKAWQMAQEVLGLAPGNVSAIVLTHFHEDHAGMAGCLARRFQAPVYMHPVDIEAYKVANGDSAAYEKGMEALCVCYGMDRAQAVKYCAVPEEAVSYVDYCSEMLPFTEGMTFPVCGGALRTLCLPGHTDGQCILIWPEEEILFAGDVLLPVSCAPLSMHHFGSGNPAGNAVDSLKHLETMTWLSAYTVLPGHGWAFGDPLGRARLTYEFYEKTGETYLKAVKAGAKNPWEAALSMEDERGKGKLRQYMNAMAYFEFEHFLGRLVREEIQTGDEKCFSFYAV